MFMDWFDQWSREPDETNKPEKPIVNFNDIVPTASDQTEQSSSLQTYRFGS